MSEFSEIDFEFMLEAHREAKKAFAMDEVPVGAVIVKNNQLIAAAHNQVETMGVASKHAELLAIEKAATILGDWRLNECTLYTTLEPCIMCAGAMILSRIKKIIWGASDLRHGAGGSIINVFERQHPIHNPQVYHGLMAQESSELLKIFFKSKRKLKS